LDCYRGASVAGSFGLGGQESSRNPGAREPRIGSVPSWQGGKIQVLGRVWAEQLGQSLGRAAWTDGVGKIASLRGIYVIIVMRVHYFTKLCMFFFIYDLYFMCSIIIC
jgi:hypothetical protein